MKLLSRYYSKREICGQMKLVCCQYPFPLEISEFSKKYGKNVFNAREKSQFFNDFDFFRKKLIILKVCND